MNGSFAAPGEESVRRTARLRTKFVLLGMILWTAAIVVRLVQLQVIDHREYKKLVTAQNQDDIEILPNRGTIRDRKGTILAEMVSMRSVHYRPRESDSQAAKMGVIRTLAPILDLDEKRIASLRESLEQKKSFIWIKRKIDPAAAASVAALKLPGIVVSEEPRRWYPHGSLAAHILGFVNIDNEGKGGVEYRFNEALQGKAGQAIVFQDTLQRPYRTEQIIAPESGQDIDLTIDAVIQYYAQRAIEKAVAENDAQWGALVASDPATGEILAMASAPTFDPNEYGKSDPISRYERAYSTQFDPGSTFKIVTMSAALENRKVATYETFDCSAQAINVAGGAIRDHKSYGVLSFSQIIAESSNIGTIQIGRRVGAALLYQTIKDFGFGETTGIELPAESAGIVHPPASWTPRSIDSISVGYEVSVTALQLMQAANIIANRGVHVPTRIIKSVNGDAWTPAGALAPTRKISSPAAEKIVDILERVVTEGTGTAAAMKGYTVAGKTGTSQIFDKVEKKYSLSHHTASFVGFVPSDKPVLSVVVVLYDPKNSAYYGGQVAAPVFREFSLQTLRYLHVLPSSESGTVLASARPGANR